MVGSIRVMNSVRTYVNHAYRFIEHNNAKTLSRWFFVYLIHFHSSLAQRFVSSFFKFILALEVLSLAMHGATKSVERAWTSEKWACSRVEEEKKKAHFMGRTILCSIIMRLATYKATRITDVTIIAILCLYWRRLSMAYAWFAAFFQFYFIQAFLWLEIF